jgi:hypothetical protein
MTAREASAAGAASFKLICRNERVVFVRTAIPPSGSSSGPFASPAGEQATDARATDALKHCAPLFRVTSLAHPLIRSRLSTVDKLRRATCQVHRKFAHAYFEQIG